MAIQIDEFLKPIRLNGIYVYDIREDDNESSKRILQCACFAASSFPSCLNRTIQGELDFMPPGQALSYYPNEQDFRNPLDQDLLGRLVHVHEPSRHELDLILRYYGLLKVKPYLVNDYGHDIIDLNVIDSKAEGEVKITRFVVPIISECSQFVSFLRMTLITKPQHTYSGTATNFMKQTVDLLFTQPIDSFGIGSQNFGPSYDSQIDVKKLFLIFLSKELKPILEVYPIRPSITLYSVCLKFLIGKSKEISDKISNGEIKDTLFLENPKLLPQFQRFTDNLDTHLFSGWYLEQDKVVKMSGTVLKTSWGSQIVTYVDKAKKEYDISRAFESLKSHQHCFKEKIDQRLLLTPLSSQSVYPIALLFKIVAMLVLLVFCIMGSFEAF
ncbi:hypothetical protein WICPIJ_008008 [Wickerhamomyces pijperi]|uniref:Uncharacterized protein n=1 Tax=Wickerhamomyces pijperi TaxID=599730 RepID=A0A9P8Q0N1_WICPI|nr:hypothetical protein WICPIJ_008008 [Wickerhamomyces pijperi]